MKIALIVPHGVAVRNFLTARFVEGFTKLGSLHVIHSLADELITPYRNRYGNAVHWHTMPPFREGAISYCLRKAFLWGHMRACNTHGMRLMLAKYHPQGLSPRAIVDRIAWAISKSSATQSRVHNLVKLHDRLSARISATAYYQSLFKKMHPDVILCADQRPPELVPAVLAARQLGIPIGTFIFSWDNLSSKGRMPTDFDFYLVWSDLMRNELLRFYPYIDAANVYVTGTPQFDPYADTDLLWERDVFCQKVGADPERPLICYAGEDIPTVPDAPAHLALLGDLIRNGKIEGDPQILARPCPAEDGSRYQKTLQNYPEVIWCPPRWTRLHNGSWQQSIPTEQDTQLLLNIIHHCALCVNVCSTMTLDFALLGKPSVNIAFDVTLPHPHGKPVWDVLFQFEHYRPVVELGAARFARSPKELAEHINAYLGDPTLDREGRLRFVELEVGIPLGQSSQRILEVLETISQ